MTRKEKIVVIIHLCLAFSLFFWIVSQPLLKEYIFQKSQEGLFQGIFERGEAFKTLPIDQQKQLIEGYEAATQAKRPSYFGELGDFLTHTLNGWVLAWLFFSLILSFLLLFHIEGARQAAWLLPLLVVAYGISLALMHPPERKESLFPSEEYVLDHYLSEPRKSRMKERKAQLLESWHRYLAAEWAHEEPSAEPTHFAEQVNRGLFAFNIKRAERLIEGKGREDLLLNFSTPPSFLQLILYFAWNFIVAWSVRPPSRSEALSNPS